MNIQIADAKVEYDSKATAEVFAQLTDGGGCDCSGCRNFKALGESAFPPEALNLFKQLGIDYKKPVEVYQNAKLESGLHNYGGWFQFVGQISGGEGSSKPGGFQTFKYTARGDNFNLYCTSHIALKPKEFGERAVVQLEFHADLPWVLNEPEMP